MRETSGNLAPLASSPLAKELTAPASAICQNAGGGGAGIDTPRPLLPDCALGSMGTRGTGGQGGESQHRQSLQVTLSGFVVEVSSGDTSTHVAIFIWERGRVFLNGCNFWLFP